MADSTPKSYHTDPQLYLYTSLTSGSSQIVTATSRLQTILNANKIPFQALDVATDEKARMLWGRRAGKRKMPGLVRMGMILGDLEQVEEWNEYGEIKENLSFAPATASASTPTPSAASTPSKAPPKQSATTASAPSSSTPSTRSTETKSPPPAPSLDQIPDSATAPSGTNAASSLTAALRQAGFEAARKATDAKTKARNDILSASNTSTATDPSKTAVSPETIQKMDQSGPTGMPPPSGITSAAEAKEPESGTTSIQGKADTVSPTGPTGDIPTATTAQQNANTSIAIDSIGSEEEVLEGSGQANPPKSSLESSAHPPSSSDPPVPPAQILEEQTHNAMLSDESHHIHLANGKRIGTPITPSSSGTATPVDEPTTGTGDTRPPISAVSEAPGTELIEPSSVAADPEDEKAADEAAPVVPLAVKGTPARAAETGSLGKAGSRAGAGGVANPSATEEEGKEEGGEGVESTVEGTVEGQALPGTRTQEQEAGKGEMVGESVAD
ncbi:MAG: hypothetical protein OHK93_002502 [Ramalina farinacea]|uniref:Uncharacterized protein n=1 Tax=Ramalina farinacea TaxID=258253 RepID=A0AA43QRH4_9LECA|nr:hypothetical protein [Ramalina farinacea]